MSVNDQLQLFPSLPCSRADNQVSPLVAFCPSSSSSLTSEARTLVQGQWTVLRCGRQSHENLELKGSIIPDLKTVRETLTRIQAVVTVGILHLRHQAGEKPVRSLPLGEGTRTHGGAPTAGWFPPPRESKLG
jgi:hypothetical protein